MSEDYLLTFHSIEECEVNRHNQDGHVLEMRGQTFDLFSNGSVAFAASEDGLHPAAEYCVAFDGLSEDGATLEAPYIRLCPKDYDTGQMVIVTKAYPICCMISNFFLLLTFVVYLLLPDLRAPLFGKIIMAFICSLFFSYLFISMIAFGHLTLVSNVSQHW